MIYGRPRVVRLNDTTDLIGIRSLVLTLLWQPSRGDLTEEEIDLEKPDIPTVSGGVLMIGEQTRQVEGGMRTTWTFQGISGNGKDVTFRTRDNTLDYGFEPGFSQVCIQRHPNFQQLIKNYGGYPDNDGQHVLWQPEIPNTANSGALTLGSASQKNPMFGVNDYFRMEGTYRCRYASLTKPSQAGVGRIFTGGLPGEAPDLEEGRNWLKCPVVYRRRGLIFDNTEMYWLSGPGGWPVPVYGNPGNNANDPLTQAMNTPYSFVPGLGYGPGTLS